MSTINLLNDNNNDIFYDDKSIYALIKNIFKTEKIDFDSVTIILSNKELLNKLKKDYFKLDHYTDVIAFNLEDENEKIQGEIYISIDDVLENSTIYKVTFNKEFKRVLIHGVLHLIGYNDISDEEKNKMRELENTHLDFITNSIIAIKE